MNGGLVQLNEGALFANDFRVVRPLSEGGMGAVYVAEQLSTGKLRALKLMLPQLVNDPRMRERFVLEAKVGARIESDHVVEVLGAGIDTEYEVPWLAMELLQGETLERRIERSGPVSVSELIEIFSQLGHALNAAHSVGIVHRDLKPENVFLSVPRREGVPFTVKVLDFGIAKMMAEQSTHTTQAIGSPLWMAPEQGNVEASVTPATDVWSLGLLAFYALTGTYFWKGAHAETPNPMSIVLEVCYDPLPTASERAREWGAPPLPPEFDEWFSHCVVRDPSVRYPGAREARAELERILKPATKRQKALREAPTGEHPVAGVRPSMEAPELDLPKPVVKPSPTPKPDPPAPAPLLIETAEPVARISNPPASNPPTSARTVSSPAMAAVVPPRASGVSSGGMPAVRPSAPPVGRPLGISGIERPSRSAPLRATATMVSPGEPAGLPWKWVVIGLVVFVAGLAVAQRVFWTRKPEPVAVTPSADLPTKGSASSPSAPLGPCLSGMARMPAGEQIESFCLDLREVTVKDYGVCQKSGKCTAASLTGNWGAVTPEEKLQRNGSCNGARADRAEHPANCVDFTQAEAYCEAQGKRLPTEAEWQWAAHGGGAKWKHPWGNEQPDIQLCWSAFTKRTSTCVVGSYPKGANGWGVSDLEGNVREWVSTGAGNDRTLCGSDWTDKMDSLATAGGCGQAPRSSKASFVGFRCAL